MHYTADTSLQTAAVGAVLTSRCPHSKVTVVGRTALAIDGVLAVLDATDDPAVLYNSTAQGGREDMNVFAAEARFAGDVVGAVFAEDRTALAKALRAVEIIEDPLPAVLSTDAALQPGSPPAHRAFGSNLIAEIVIGAPEDALAEALANSPHVFDSSYEIDPSPIGFLEPIAATAEWIGDTCYVTSTAQLPPAAAATTALLLGVPVDRVVLRPVSIGGSFGGKEEVHLEPVAALGSRVLGGRKVSVEMTRAQMSRFRHRHGGTLRVRTGVDNQGRFLARQLDWVVDAGPYAFHSPDIAGNGGSLVHALYHAGCTRTVARVVTTNHTPGGAFRGYGGEQALFAVESHIDEIARALDLDPFDIRRRNMLKAGDIDQFWEWPVESFSLDRCLDVAQRYLADHPRGPRDPGDGRARGRGFAALANVSSISGPWGTDKAAVRCSIDSRGRVQVDSGIVEMGQGIHTSLQSAVQDQLPGLTAWVNHSGTDTAPDDLGVYASRGTYLTVGAAVEAARALLQLIQDRVNGIPIEVLSEHGVKTQERSHTWAELGSLASEATFEAPDNALSAGVQIADVAVDLDTGHVEVEQVVSIHDVGALLHPGNAVSQVEGGVVQGIGFALSERAHIDTGGVTTTLGFLDHLIPTAASIPDIHAVFVTDRPNPHSPLGAKGLGECPVMAVAPAVANAIADAVSVRCRHLPFTGERVLDALDSTTSTLVAK
ncbi:MAG: xanthine dehydrogenase family protein molybdopterin-binding subunit [Mycobacterium sp.]